MIDPRSSVVARRLEGVGRVLAVTGGKGGIGKSVVASLLARSIAAAGRPVGLLDLDLTGPCDHLILGVEDGFPDEEFGVEPLRVDGIRFMSVSCFCGDRPAPLRGTDLTGAVLEMLAITRWGELDALVIDMPPGLGDTALDVVRLLPSAEYVAVTTPSKVVLQTVRRTVGLLSELRVPIVGIIENMAGDDSSGARELARTFDLAWLGAVPFDPALEPALGDRSRLAGTAAAAAVDAIAGRLLE